MTLLARPIPARGCLAKGRRSPSEVRQEAEECIRRCGYLALRDIAIEDRGDHLCLSGHLPTYYLKQIAQAVVSEVAGVHRVVNRIEVIAPAGRPSIGRDPRGPMAGIPG
jgi:hypothetical protein